MTDEHNDFPNTRLSADDNGWLIRASVRCQKCGAQHVINVNEMCTCSCGYRFYVDVDSCVHDIPISLEKLSYEYVSPWMPSRFLSDERRHARFEEIFSVVQATVGVDVTASSLYDPLPQKSIAQLLSRMHSEHAESLKDDAYCIKKIGTFSCVLGILGWWAAVVCPCPLIYGVIVIVVLAWARFVWLIFPRKRLWFEKIEQLKRDIPQWLRQESVRLEEDIAAYAEKMHQDSIRQAEEQRQAKERKKILKDDEQLAQCICSGRMPFSEFVRNVRNGDGHAYEIRLQSFFKRLNISCEKVSDSADQGVDLIVEKNDRRIAIQCKFYKRSVGNSAVQEAFAGREYYSCQEAWVVSNAEFTKSAKELAETIRVSLVGQNELVTQMKKSGIL